MEEHLLSFFPYLSVHSPSSLPLYILTFRLFPTIHDQSNDLRKVYGTRYRWKSLPHLISPRPLPSLLIKMDRPKLSIYSNYSSNNSGNESSNPSNSEFEIVSAFSLNISNMESSSTSSHSSSNRATNGTTSQSNSISNSKENQILIIIHNFIPKF